MAPVAADSATSCCLVCPCRWPITRRRELRRPCRRTCAPCSRDRLRGCGTASGAFIASPPAIHGLRPSQLPIPRSWMTGKEAELLSCPCTTPSIAAPSGSKARMFEHMDVQVRAGPLGARSAGKSRQHDVAETVVPGAWLWLLSPKGKQPARQETCGSKTGTSVEVDATGTVVLPAFCRNKKPPARRRGSVAIRRSRRTTRARSACAGSRWCRRRSRTAWRRAGCVRSGIR